MDCWSYSASRSGEQGSTLEQGQLQIRIKIQTQENTSWRYPGEQDFRYSFEM